jgi:hypothetical protein
MNNTISDFRTDTEEGTMQGEGSERSGSGRETHGVDLKKYLDAGRNVGRTLEDQIVTRPYVALGIVGGAGFLLGSLIGSRVGQIAVAIGIGFAATKVMQGKGLETMKDVAKKVNAGA